MKSLFHATCEGPDQTLHNVGSDLALFYIYVSLYYICLYTSNSTSNKKKKQSVNVFFWCVFFCVCGGGGRTLNIQKDRHAKNIVIQVFKVCQSCND